MGEQLGLGSAETAPQPKAKPKAKPPAADEPRGSQASRPPPDVHGQGATTAAAGGAQPPGLGQPTPWGGSAGVIEDELRRRGGSMTLTEINVAFPGVKKKDLEAFRCFNITSEGHGAIQVSLPDSAGKQQQGPKVSGGAGRDEGSGGGKGGKHGGKAAGGKAAGGKGAGRGGSGGGNSDVGGFDDRGKHRGKGGAGKSSNQGGGNSWQRDGSNYNAGNAETQNASGWHQGYGGNNVAPAPQWQGAQNWSGADAQRAMQQQLYMMQQQGQQRQPPYNPQNYPQQYWG